MNNSLEDGKARYATVGNKQNVSDMGNTHPLKGPVQFPLLGKLPKNRLFGYLVRIMDNASLTNTDLNVFLKHWLDGGCPRLKLFCARTGSVDIFRVLAGLRHNAVRVENRRDYNSPYGHKWNLWDEYDIQREDGVTATVHYEPLSTLVIAVWPETTHNYN
ncbi:hypothetical protein GCK72_015569 [Caenorhabditis remanei]|uniref:Sdz-33 F-box domain-containing protein n=1 Tax=Caenorhabditis remanei TaxID=31234 RepID=A0A6A5GUF1_CAERE|nr:hypothetical protein GCK72_015569 [Caenorhabditis remanei]KAF1759108.1 hypothetical protein GCK72_015569 [Caenorhabditis remanei]